MDSSTATPGSPGSQSSGLGLGGGPWSPPTARGRRPRVYRGKRGSMGRGFDAFLASSASRLARRRRDSSVQDCEKYTAEAASRGYAAVRERKRQTDLREWGANAPPEPLTDLVALQAPKPGTWIWSPALAAALEKQSDHATVPRYPVNLPDYIVDCQDWEWITAIVRSVLLHNIDHFAHTYSAIEKGDKYFMGGRGQAIVDAAVRARPPQLYGPETLPRPPSSHDGDDSSEDGNIFRGDYEDFLVEKNRPTPGQLLRLAAARRKRRELPTHDASAPLLEYAFDHGDAEKLQLVEDEFEHLTRTKRKVRTAGDVVKGPRRRGERDLRNLWAGSWGKALGRDAELRRLEKVREKRRLEAKPAWRSLIEPVPDKVPGKVPYKATRLENRMDYAKLRRKAKGAGQLFFFQRRAERDAKAKISDDVAARRAAREAAQQLREGHVVRTLMAFDAERLKVFEQLKVVVRLCADPEALNASKRDAFADLIEALGPPAPLRRPPILGMQRATIDAVEAIAAWHAGEVPEPVVFEEEEEEEVEAPAPAASAPQTMSEKLAEIKRRAAAAEHAVRTRTPPPTPPPDPPPFLWNGVDFLLCLRGALDFLAHAPDLRAHVGDEFPLRDNPFMRPTGLDGEIEDGGASDGGEDLGSDSDDDTVERARKAKKLTMQERAASWPRLGDSEHQARVDTCRAYVLRHERRYRARADAEQVMLAHTRRVRNEDEARRKLFARAKSHPWEFLDAGDPDGTKAEKRRRGRRVAQKPGCESLPQIRVRL